MAALLFLFVALATPAAADVAIAQNDSPAYSLTVGRFWSLLGAGLGVIGVVTGGLIRTRVLGGVRTRRRNAILAMSSGLAGSVIGGFVVVFADGGPGSGSGIVGGYLAMLIGLLAIAVGWSSMNRTAGRVG